MEISSLDTSFAIVGRQKVSKKYQEIGAGATRTFGAYCESGPIPTMAGSTFAQQGPLTGVGGPIDEGEVSIAG